MSLKNSFHTELAIGILISDEETLDAKLSLLTEISLTSKNKETFGICEAFRERLCCEEVEKVGRVQLPFKYRRSINTSEGYEKCDSNNGDE